MFVKIPLSRRLQGIILPNLTLTCVRSLKAFNPRCYPCLSPRSSPASPFRLRNQGQGQAVGWNSGQRATRLGQRPALDMLHHIVYSFSFSLQTLFLPRLHFPSSSSISSPPETRLLRSLLAFLTSCSPTLLASSQSFL